MIGWPHAVARKNGDKALHSCASTGTNPRDFSALDGPEHGVNGFDSVHQFLCVSSGNFDLTSAAQLGCVPEGGVKFRVCLKVDWLEEIRPENKKFMLALLRFFVFDGCIAAHGVEVGSHGFRTEHLWVFEGEHFLGHGLNGFSSNSSAGGVIDTAWSVAVCRGFNLGQDVVIRHDLLESALVHEHALTEASHDNGRARFTAQRFKGITGLAKDCLQTRLVKGRLHQTANFRSH